MDEIWMPPRPLLLKHRLTVSLWCLTAVNAPFAFKLYSQQLYILTGEALSYHSVHLCTHFLSFHQTTYLFKLNYSNQFWELRVDTISLFFCPCLYLSLQHYWVARSSNEGHLPSGLYFITVLWSDLGCRVPPVSCWARVCVFCVCRSMR